MQFTSGDGADGRGAPQHPERGPRRTPLRYGFALLAAALLAAGIYLALRPRHAHTVHAAGPAQGSYAPGGLPRCGAVCDPIDARYLTDVRFGRTSF